MLAAVGRDGKHLPNGGRLATSRSMIDRASWKRWLSNPIVDWTVFVVGVVLILLSPVVGAIPGPGGVFVFALGLAMVLRTSRWARRRYVHFKRWQPKAGRWTDWGLRRGSARRREAKEKERIKDLDRKIAGVPPGAPVPTVAPTAQAGPKSAAQLSREMDARLAKRAPGD